MISVVRMQSRSIRSIVNVADLDLHNIFLAVVLVQEFLTVVFFLVHGHVVYLLDARLFDDLGARKAGV